MIPEEYNDYGEIVEKQAPVRSYTRTMTTYDKHMIHKTKDLFDGDCSLCQKWAKEWRKRNDV
jgi:hypothetical protein